jgi:hypothetical protein
MQGSKPLTRGKPQAEGLTYAPIPVEWLTRTAQGAIAQLVEHFNGIEGVSGSNPLSSIV